MAAQGLPGLLSLELISKVLQLLFGVRKFWEELSGDRRHMAMSLCISPAPWAPNAKPLPPVSQPKLGGTDHQRKRRGQAGPCFGLGLVQALTWQRMGLK